MTHARALDSRALVVCALLMEVSFALLHFARSPAEQVALVLLSYLVSGLAFGWLLWRLRRAGQQPQSRWALRIVIVAAIAFRLTLLPLSPATSQDVQRYRWEGLVQLRGYSPYILAPNAGQLTSLASEHPTLWQSINHPDVPAIYPPFAQSLFLLNAAAFGGSLLGWKLILLVFDGLLAGGLYLLLRKRSLVPALLAGVLWCPLLLLETYEAGHLDLIGATLVALTILALTRQHPVMAGITLGLSISVKYLWPLVLLIVFARHAARQRRCAVFLTAAVLVTLASWIPHRDGLASAVATARMFAESWTFNDLVFEQLRRLPGPPWVPMAVVLAFLLAMATLLASRRPQDLWSDVWLLIGTALLLSPVAYPWYFMWVVPGLAFRPPLWIVVWLISVPALHLVDWRYVSTGLWDPMPWLWGIVSVAPALLLFRAWLRRLRYGDRDESQAPAVGA
jgi:hypothetical protein